MKKLAVLGAGSWGLTLSWLSALNAQEGSNHEVWLWDRSPEKIEAIKQNRKLSFPVEITLQPSIRLTSSLAEAVNDAAIILLVVTSSGTREVVRQLSQIESLSGKAVVVNCSKGIELPSLMRMTEVIKAELPQNELAVLSGPSLAVEVIRGLPTACSIASENLETAEYLQQYLTNERLFRLYSNTDVVGVELGGALKNIFAIPSGYMQAKGLGDNAMASLITRGLSEMTRFCVAMGADPKTLYGLSGLGDLLATCNSPLSRNYQVGVGLAQGENVDAILKRLKVVAEGVKTTEAVSRLADKIGLDMPIVKQVETCLNGPFSEEMIIKSLMSRKLKAEHQAGSR